MSRIKRDLYGRERAGGIGAKGTHRIKIGWWKPGNNGGKQALKLRGFLICHATNDREGHLIIAYDLMEALGYSREKVDRAVREHWKAPDGLLPTELEIVLKSDAKRVNDVWEWGEAFAESFELVKARPGGKSSETCLFCRGDGFKATRRQDDGTSSVIECVPRGTPDVEPKHLCPYSVAGQCKRHTRFIALVGRRDESGRLVPLARYNALYQLDTKSLPGGGGIGKALDAAADIVEGHTHGISGTLSFHIESVAQPDGGTAPGPQLRLVLNEAEIRQRRQELNGLFLAAHSMPVQVLENKTLAIEAPKEDRAEGPEDLDDAEVIDSDEVDDSDPNEVPADSSEPDDEGDDLPWGGGLDPRDEGDLDALKEALADLAEQRKCQPGDILLWYTQTPNKRGTSSVAEVEDFLRGDNEQHRNRARGLIGKILMRRNNGDVPSAADIAGMLEGAGR